MRNIVFALALWSFGDGAVARAETPCTPDDALSEAAANLLLSGEALSPSSLREATRRVGSDAVLVEGLRVPVAHAARLTSWLGTHQAAAKAPLTCGRAEDNAQIVTLVAERGGSLEPNPSNERIWRVKLAKGFRHPRVIVASDDESGLDLEMDPKGIVTVPEEIDPPFTIQLVAEDTLGPRPVAERSVGSTLPLRAASTGAGAVDMNEWLRRYREENSVGPLRPNRLLQAAALEHATMVCKDGRAAHRLEDGDPESRLRAQGVAARVVGEAIARARNQGEAAAALERSPSHAATLLDSRFTDVGLAVTSSPEGTACLTVLLAAWPRAVPRPPAKP